MCSGLRQASYTSVTEQYNLVLGNSALRLGR